jgi:glycosyltransferase involved in cell wall biosynthesis
VSPPVEGRRILYLQYVNPGSLPPLEHGSRILADRGWEVRFIGVGGGPTAAIRLPDHPRIHVRLVPGAAHGWRLRASYVRFAAAALAEAVRWRPDWIYVSDVLAAPVALLLSTITPARIAYHEHDWPDDTDVSAFQRACLRARSHLAPRTALLVAPNAERARWLGEEVAGHRHVEVVWNCPRTDEVGPARARFEPPLRLLYQGSINSALVPPNLVRALVDAPGVELVLAGYETVGSRGHIAELTALAAELGVADRVKYRGAMPRAELTALRQECELGLVMFPRRHPNRNLGAMVGASNKLFDYMSAGICPIVSDLPEWREAIADPGFALMCDPDDPRSIAGVLRRCVAEPELCREIGERGRQAILARWNYASQFPRVLAALEADPAHPSLR